MKDHLGNIYKNKAEMCKAYDISPPTLNKRINEGYSLEEALTIKRYETRKLHSCSKPIICVETGRVFHSIRYASKEMNIDSKSIRRVIDNPNNKSCGYHWKRV